MHRLDLKYPNFLGTTFLVFFFFLHKWGEAPYCHLFHYYWLCSAIHMIKWYFPDCSRAEVLFFITLNTPKSIAWYIRASRVSVQFSLSVMSDSLWPHESQHARPPYPSPTPRVYPNPCPSSWWGHPAISSSVIPFSSGLQCFPASGSLQMSQLFLSGGQRIGVSASTSVPPMNTQDGSPLGWTGWIFLQSKGLSRVFSNTTVQKHQFFGTQLSL